MIKEPLSCTIECLETANIQHNLFILPNCKRELQIWDGKRFGEVLNSLDSSSIVVDSIIRNHVDDEDGSEPYDLYLIKF